MRLLSWMRRKIPPPADEDVPHAPRLRLQDGHHGRHNAGGSPESPHKRAARCQEYPYGVEGVSFVGLRRDDDIVRSDLVMRIVDAYEGAGEGDRA